MTSKVESNLKLQIKTFITILHNKSLIKAKLQFSENKCFEPVKFKFRSNQKVLSFAALHVSVCLFKHRQDYYFSEHFHSDKKLN